MENLPDDPAAAVALRASMADVQAELIDSIAGMDRMIASLTARRAELIDQANTWSQLTIDQVVPVGQPDERRAELARRSFTAEIACALRISHRHQASPDC